MGFVYLSHSQFKRMDTIRRLPTGVKGQIRTAVKALSVPHTNHYMTSTYLQDTIDIRRSTIELIPYIGRGWKDSNLHYRRGKQSKLLLMSLTYTNIITYFFENVKYFYLREE